MQNTTATDRGIPALPSYFVLVAVSVAAYSISWAQLADIWLDMESRYSHGALLAAAVIALLILRGPSVSTVAERGISIVAAAVAALLGAAWVILTASGFDTLAQAAALATLVVLPFLVANAVAARRIAALILVMFTAIPLWDNAGPALQWLTAQVVEFLLRLTPVNAEFDGFSVILASGVFEIVEGCNGLQLLLAALSIGGLHAWLCGAAPAKAVMQIAAFVAVGLVSNWLRIFIVVLVGDASDMQHYLVQNEHYTLGWSVFTIGTLVLVWLLRGQPFIEADRRSEGGLPFSSVLKRGALAASAVLVFPLLLLLRSGSDAPELPSLPSTLAGWSASAVTAPADHAVALSLARPGEFTGPAVIVERPRPWAELPSRNDAAAMSGFRESDLLSDNGQFSLQRAVDSTGRSAVVLTSYLLDGHSASNLRRTQFSCGIQRIITGSQQCITIVVTAPCIGDCERAEQEAQTVYEAVLTGIEG